MDSGKDTSKRPLRLLALGNSLPPTGRQEECRLVTIQLTEVDLSLIRWRGLPWPVESLHFEGIDDALRTTY
jgi:hypothetical protein